MPLGIMRLKDKVRQNIMTNEQFFKNLLNEYSLVSVLSNKNDCKVYRVRNNTFKKDMVVRSLPSSITAYQELCSISCDNLPLIYDVITLDDGQIVLEEYIYGINLAQAMECKKFTYKTAKPVILSICNALGVLHKKGIVHRDVKPENVMIDKNGRVVLIDFNASRKISNASKDTVIIGTVGYASPEQLGIRESDARTDIYALGILLNVMITGKHPSETIAKGKAGRVVRKCTNVNPDERYKSVEKLIFLL